MLLEEKQTTIRPTAMLMLWITAACNIATLKTMQHARLQENIMLLKKN